MVLDRRDNFSRAAVVHGALLRERKHGQPGKSHGQRRVNYLPSRSFVHTKEPRGHDIIFATLRQTRQRFQPKCTIA